MSKTLFPGKETRSTSFNLTAFGRELLKNGALERGISVSDFVELIVKDAWQYGFEVVADKVSGPKGGAKSLFFGKNRGTTTAVCLTADGRALLDEQSSVAGLSRGDFIELMLRADERDSQELDNESEVTEDLLLKAGN